MLCNVFMEIFYPFFAFSSFLSNSSDCYCEVTGFNLKHHISLIAWIKQSGCMGQGPSWESTRWIGDQGSRAAQLLSTCQTFAHAVCWRRFIVGIVGSTTCEHAWCHWKGTCKGTTGKRSGNCSHSIVPSPLFLLVTGATPPSGMMCG